MSDIIIQIDGVRYSYFKEMSVVRSFETFSGTFSFTTSGGVNKDYPIKVGQECIIKIDEHPIITGFVETIDGPLDVGSDEITITGRDKTADLIDSTLGDNLNLNAPFTLTTLTEHLLKLLNINDIKVISNESLPSFSEASNMQFGTTAFAYLEKYAQKRGVLLTTNGDGSIVFSRATTDVLTTVLSLDPSAAALIKSRTFRRDNTKRFNRYILKNQNNDSTGIYFTATNKNSVDAQAIAIDNEIRTSRIYNFVCDHSTTADKDLETRVKWEANFRRAQSFSYTCVVQGFYAPDDNILWTPNTLIRVFDEEADINSTLLISSVTYNLSNDDGSTTELKLLTRDSFTLQVNKPEKETSDQPESNNYFSNPNASLDSQ